MSRENLDEFIEKSVLNGNKIFHMNSLVQGGAAIAAINIAKQFLAREEGLGKMPYSLGNLEK